MGERNIKYQIFLQQQQPFSMAPDNNFPLKLQSRTKRLGQRASSLLPPLTMLIIG